MRSPLLGYNTNVRHHGKLFHIQTEDSGATHGHIFTHLFADGGRIIATKKSTYAQWVETDRYPDIVKKLMQAQHKAMFIALRDGLFDEDEAAGAREFAAREIRLEEEVVPSIDIDVEVLEKAADGFVPQSHGGPSARGPSAAASTSVGPATGGGASSGGGVTGAGVPSGSLRAPLPPPIPDSVARATRRVGGRGNVTASFAATRPSDLNAAGGSSSGPGSSGPGSSVSGSSVSPRQGAVQGANSSRAPSATSAGEIHSGRPAAGTSPGAASAPPTSGASRYQSTRSAVPARSKGRPVESVFGADFLSEKSLDEVIMSYLAEDLDDNE